MIVTSNKRDILDATRGLREGDDEVWVFDPQHVAGNDPDLGVRRKAVPRRELRHSFVSLLSESGLSIEQISPVVTQIDTQVMQEAGLPSGKPASDLRGA